MPGVGPSMVKTSGGLEVTRQVTGVSVTEFLFQLTLQPSKSQYLYQISLIITIRILVYNFVQVVVAYLRCTWVTLRIYNNNDGLIITIISRVHECTAGQTTRT